MEDKQMIFPWWSETRKFKQKKTDSYQEFTDKFKPKRTTDDCYTPEKVYENLKTYVFKKYGLDPNTPVVRPFWPGADFTACNYPAGCIVIDNPPFSILGKIIKYYTDNRVRFFLFAPALTVMQHAGKGTGITFISTEIVYENGAKVRTAFIHNLDNAITCSGVLDRLVRQAQDSGKKTRKIKWPDNWLAASDFMNKARRIDENEEYCVNLYSSLKETGNVQRFGGGVLVADAVADDFRGMRKDEDGIPVELKDCDKETVRSLNKWEEQERKRRQPGG